MRIRMMVIRVETMLRCVDQTPIYVARREVVIRMCA